MVYVGGSEAAIVGETNSRPNMPSSAVASVEVSAVGSGFIGQEWRKSNFVYSQ